MYYVVYFWSQEFNCCWKMLQFNGRVSLAGFFPQMYCFLLMLLYPWTLNFTERVVAVLVKTERPT